MNNEASTLSIVADLDKCSELIRHVDSLNSFVNNHSQQPPSDQETLKQNEQIKQNAEANATKYVESFRALVDKYQEQPELLDPYLTDLICQLANNLLLSIPNKESESILNNLVYHTKFKFLYQLIKVRGFKHIGTKFPHDTKLLPTIVEHLSLATSQDGILYWQTKYGLITWLSIVILTPFDLKKFETEEDGSKLQTTIYRILLESLKLHDSSHHVASYCLAKFLSRQDVLSSSCFDDFISNFTTPSQNKTFEDKHLRALCYVFKFVPPKSIKPYVSDLVLSFVDKVNLIKSEAARHMVIKLFGRAALAILPARQPSWRYRSSTKILVPTQCAFEHVPTPFANLQVCEKTIENEDDFDEVSSEESTKIILNELLCATGDAYTKIRYSASKSIAKICSRLSHKLAGDVIDSILDDSFKPSSSELLWHGGCLTLAELCRAGLLTESKLERVLSVIKKSIVYEKIKGNFSIGAHVREAACYVCWAIARIYDIDILKPIISLVSESLLCTLLFDRELQCRRAASAAFQELIGRQGTSSEDMLSMLHDIDYNSIGLRQSCYLEIAPKLARLDDQYWKTFVEHLLATKVGHWDLVLRKLASDSIAAMCLNINREYIQDKLIPQLFSLVEQNTDNNSKHGAMLAIAKITKSLVPLQFVFDEKFSDYYASIPQNCSKQLKSKLTQAIFNDAVCNSIVAASVASIFPQSNRTTMIKNVEESACAGDGSAVLDSWLSISLSTLDSDNVDLRAIGSDALFALYSYYYLNNKTNQDKILTSLNLSVKSKNESTRCGALLTLSKLSQTKLDCDSLQVILISLTSYTSQETKDKKNGNVIYAEAKAAACKALVDFLVRIDKNLLVVMLPFVMEAITGLLRNTDDYSCNERGDVGVKVRSAAVKSLQRLVCYLADVSICKTILQKPQIITQVVSKTLKEAVSYHNTIRDVAGNSFYKLIQCSAQDTSIGTNTEDRISKLVIPHCEKIINLFNKFSVDETFDWQFESLPVLMHLLEYSQFGPDMWRGLLSGLGQISEMGSQMFQNAFTKYIHWVEENDEFAEKTVNQIFAHLMQTLNANIGNDRFTNTALVALDHVLMADIFGLTEQNQQELAQYCWRCAANGGATSGSKRLLALNRVLPALLQFPSVAQESLTQNLKFLHSCQVPKMREDLAKQLLLSFELNQPIIEKALGAGEEQESATVNASTIESTAVASGEKDAQIAGGIENKHLHSACPVDIEKALDLLRESNWSELDNEQVAGSLRQLCTFLSLNTQTIIDI